MIPVTLKFYGIGRRWFSGKKINKNYSKDNFPHLFDNDGLQRTEEECSSEEVSDVDLEDDDTDDTDHNTDDIEHVSQSEPIPAIVCHI